MNAEQAQEKVRSLIGNQTGLVGIALRALPFSHGWLVSLASEEEAPLGAPRYTVDKTDGAVRAYPSNVPTRRIIDEYVDIKDFVPVIG